MSDPPIFNCPKCGSTYTHQGEVEVFTRMREDGPISAIVVAPDGGISKGDPDRNPSYRRQGLILNFECEECDAELEMRIWQHKGQTFYCWSD